MPEDSGQLQRYCRQCGAEVRTGTRFCVSCGVALVAGTGVSQSKQNASALKNMPRAEGQGQADNSNPREQDIPKNLGEPEKNRIGSQGANRKPSILSRVKTLTGENKKMTITLTALGVLITLVGAINDFSGLLGMWSDEDANTGRPYMGIEVKDYAPVLSSFVCAVEDSSSGTLSECERGQRNEDIKSELSKRGALQITGVVPDSPAAKAGVRTDDLITGIDRYNVAGAAEFSRIMEEYHPGDTVRLSLYRADEDGYLQQESVRVVLGE